MDKNKIESLGWRFQIKLKDGLASIYKEKNFDLHFSIQTIFFLRKTHMNFLIINFFCKLLC